MQVLSQCCTLLLCLATVFGQSIYDKQPDIGGIVLEQIDHLNQAIDALQNADSHIEQRLNGLETENSANSLWRDELVTQFFPDLFADQNRQDAEIAELERATKELLLNGDDIANLKTELENIQNELAQLAEMRESIIQRIEDITKQQNSQADSLEFAKQALDALEHRLADLELRIHQVEKKIKNLTDTINKLVDIFAEEVAESFEFTLDRKNSEVRFDLTETYGGRIPTISYGVNALHISDHTQSFEVPISNPYAKPSGYDDDKKTVILPDFPHISYTVDVSVDSKNNKIVARFFDLSNGGWTVDKVIIQASVFRLNDDEIKVYQ